MRRILATAIVALLSVSVGSAAAEPPRDHGVAIGTFISGSYAEPSLYDEWQSDTGHRPVILGSYKSWSIPLIDSGQLDDIWSRGAVPLVTWEPWGGSGEAFRLRDIAAGAYDSYIESAARATAAWGRPVFIRFAHEMNGGWYPWGRGANGNTPQIYKDAWRRVVDAFRAAGADNALWVWGPNQNFSGRFPFAQFYPGDQWVDWAALDGFNWARSPRWQSFSEIFGSSYNALLRLTDRPIMIAETGSWQQGGSKADWVSDMLARELPSFDHIRALVWWSVEDWRGDLRVESSDMALKALRWALDSPIYELDRQELLATPPRLPDDAAVPLARDRVSVGHKVERELKENHLWLGAGVLIGCLLVLLAALIRARLRRPSPPPHDATL